MLMLQKIVNRNIYRTSYLFYAACGDGCMLEQASPCTCIPSRKLAANQRINEKYLISC